MRKDNLSNSAAKGGNGAEIDSAKVAQNTQSNLGGQVLNTPHESTAWLF